MNEWKKVKIGDFLKQYRNTIYVDDSQQYKQVTISSKSGVKYRCSKIGKEIGRKRQFLIDLKTYPNTVIFTRQGLHEGAIGLAPQEVDGCIVTENMPMFSVNETIVDTFYLKYFLLSPAFSSLISTLTPTGSAQKSIHERDLLPLEISLPDLQTQQKIVCELAKKIEKVELVKSEIESQKNYAKQLRQNILQEAIEGKLTEEWRKENPVIKGNPDFDAEALFEKIQEEKCHTDSELPLETSLRIRNSKKKVFEPIAENELPFEIPKGWKWVRLGEVSESCLGKMLDSTKNQGTKRKYLRNINVRWFSFDLSDLLEMKIKDIELARCSAQKGDLLICEGGYPGRSAIWNENYEICFQKAIHRVRFFYMPEMSRIFNLYLFLLSENKQIEMYLTGEAIRHLTGVKLKQILIPLPPLAEQKEIVSRVEKLLANVTELEKQITEREEMTKQLMQSIMKDAFN